MVHAKKKPCSRCPYTLGMLQTVINPCPECRMNGYQSYEWFQDKKRAQNALDEILSMEKRLSDDFDPEKGLRQARAEKYENFG